MMANTTVTPPRWLAGPLRPYWAPFWLLIQLHVVRRMRSYGLVVALDVVVVTAAYESATIVRFADDTSAAIAQVANLFLPCLLAGTLYAIVAYLLGLHRRLWHFASLRDGYALIRAVGISTLLIGALDLAGLPPLRVGPGALHGRALPLSVVIGGACLSFLFLGAAKVLPRVAFDRQPVTPAGIPRVTTRVLIIGAGQAGASLAARFLLNSGQGYHVAGFVDDDPAKWHGRIRGISILGTVEEVPCLAERLAIDLIAVAVPSAPSARIGEILAVCQQTAAGIKILPGFDEIVGRQPHGLHLREVNVADLLGREIVPLRAAMSEAFLAGKTVLVTGAAGSIGSELCRQLLTYRLARVIALDNNETGLFDLAASLQSPENGRRLQLRIGDIADTARMLRLFAQLRPQVIFHAAAYKHVPLLEEHPEQAARVNVLASYRLCRVASLCNAEAFVFISSDKAADPVSVLGASKRIGELVVQAMAQSGRMTTRFCAVRFGNVIGSRGSVVPTFAQQIEHGGPVTVTDPEATRYFMTIPEACGLVILTATGTDGGGLFQLDMGEPIRIVDLAATMIRLRGLRVERDIPIVYTGLRPGERLHELLAGPGEQLLATTHSKIHRVINQTETPTLADIDRWLQTLQDALTRRDGVLVRACLFDLIQAHALI
jgi:FlaA1/EpsC-like NDP-sugar epimerase